MNEGVPLIWIDCEMTGLNLPTDALVEVAALVTDENLNPIGSGVEVVIKPPASALAQMSDFVREMHTDSGLLPLLEQGRSLSEAEELILEYLESSGVPAGKAPLAGNSLWLDRNFIARDLPRVNQYIHYRSVDVSSIKELAKRWYPKAYFAAPEKSGNHRALGDVRDSIAELAHYRASIFRDLSNE
ncbi:MAG: oligoribonuclease [Actinobacteria bacterium]|nr:oligoribonuclease [Actinomycetota bacterium]